MVTIEEFRQKLEEATNKTHPREHAQLVDSLKDIYPHSIRCLSSPLTNDRYAPKVINTIEDCFLYVFKDIFSHKMLKAFKKVLDIFEMHYKDIGIRLISEGILELHNSWKDDDHVVVYFNNSIPVHFGKIDKRAIISKWGVVHVWMHGLWEVPLSYGNTVKFSDGQVNETVFWKVIMSWINSDSIKEE